MTSSGLTTVAMSAPLQISKFPDENRAHISAQQSSTQNFLPVYFMCAVTNCHSGGDLILSGGSQTAQPEPGGITPGEQGPRYDSS